MTTNITMGQLVADLFAKYERQYHDEELAAVATEVTLDDLMRARRHDLEQRVIARVRGPAAVVES